MSISKILFQTLCVFSQIKDRKHIEQNFHSVAMVMPPGWDLWVLGGVKNFSVGICDGAPSTARSIVIFFQIVLAYMICKLDHLMFSPTWLTNQQYS